MPRLFTVFRTLSRRVPALACAVALAGCTALSDGKGSFWSKSGTEHPAAETTATAPPDEASVEATRDEGENSEGSPEADTSPAWNLRTLQTIADPQADALTLSRAWMLALENDPDYQAALSARAAAATEIRLGRAALLPQIQAGYSRNRISGLQRQYAGARMREGELDYDSTSAYVQLQQPIFNLDRYATFQRGYARAELGEAEFAVREYEIGRRLIAVYMDAVAAQGALGLAQALAESLEEQVATREALFERAEGDRVDAQEARARLALARAEVIAAEDALRVARRQLQTIIGEEPPPLIDIGTIEPGKIELNEPLSYWLERGQSQGAIIRAAQAQVRVADTEVRRAVARHVPTADFVMAFSDADSENLDSLSQRSNTFTVGLHVAIPIFSGGYDTANHARSRHERQRAMHDLNKAREESAAEVIRQYSAIEGGAEQIAALMAAVRSGEQSLEAARQGYRYGVNSNLDVLRRQDSLFHVRNELLAARVVWLEARIALAAAAGEPIAPMLIELDRLLAR